MSWFLKKHTHRPKTARSRKSESSPSWNPQRTLTGLKFIGIVIAVIGSITIWRYSKHALASYVAVHGNSVVESQSITLVDKPLWMNQMVRDHLHHLIQQEISYDPLDHVGLQQAVRALSSNPWVDHVQQIQRTDQGGIEVIAQYRRPVALVEWDKGYHLVSAQGVQLPGFYLNHQLKQLELPLIMGVASPPRRNGQIWPGNDLEAGLSLLDWLSDEPYFDQIRSIDVNGRDDHNRVHLILRTDHGMVRWGLPPAMQQVVEPNASTKKQWLTDVYRQRGTIDAGGKIVDVYGAAIFVHQPVAYDNR